MCCSQIADIYQRMAGLQFDWFEFSSFNKYKSSHTGDQPYSETPPYGVWSLGNLSLKPSFVLPRLELFISLAEFQDHLIDSTAQFQVHYIA